MVSIYLVRDNERYNMNTTKFTLMTVEFYLCGEIKCEWNREQNVMLNKIHKHLA